MSHGSRAPDREQKFNTLYDALYPDLVRFVQRRAHPDHVQDVVADAFLVVWRRLDDLPPHHDDARAWVFGITRKVMLNSRRGDERRRALGVRLAENAIRDPERDPEADLVLSRINVTNAWRLLSDVQQEALGLAVLEELTAPQAAAVLGISPVAFRLRLSRARRALRVHLDHLPHSYGAPSAAQERTTTS